MIEIVIPFRSRSIGVMDVRRVLPFPKRRSVGPFVFVDDFGPVEIVRDRSLDVLPHPHIGLATVTYLLSGKMTHRDSLGTRQIIEPNEVNWMSAGRGIVHSERVSDAPVKAGEKLVGLQTWVALPENAEESAPTFAHHKSDDLPVVEADGAQVKIILGEAFGKKSRVETLSNPLYVECRMADKKRVQIPAQIEERSVYILSGALLIDGKRFEAGTMVVFLENVEVWVEALGATVCMIIGGDRLEKPRYMWWNFVSTSRERIERAKEDWRAQNFGAIPGDAEEFVPLPDDNNPKPVPQPL
ncbi:MAG: Pirin [uncultured Pyrinomonadaceae bacterium]|uniref:Pirin n=1 Tax=uncultured Pyrinomonadaceae bacterium TaxID=2283094 RepID=A0A6J4PQC9_9BACT|nr:MAG: Pirin [uncultured Pyrinomonadaceae bacterium]